MRSIICGALMALAITTAGAEDKYNSAEFMLPHCKLALTDRAEQSFLAGMCVGSIRAIARLAATPRASALCAALPDSVTPELTHRRASIKGMRASMFDPKCLDLARHFLSDVGNTQLVNELAEHIQNEVEIWLETEKRTLARERKKHQAE